MPRQFQKLDLPYADSIVRTAVHAYPGMGKTPEHQADIREWVTCSMTEWPWQDLYGIVDEGQLLGSLCLFALDFNVRGQLMKAGGIGSVQTALLHRKQRVAYDLMQSTLRHCREQGITLVTLYPFRASFYRKMGFGYGAEIRQYHVSPSDFPKVRTGRGTQEGKIRELTPSREDRELAIHCYDEFFRSTNGMSARLDRSMGESFNPERTVLGYEENGRLTGYMVLDFESEHPLKSNLRVAELVYNAPAALHAFSDFLRRQADQVGKVIIETQDETLQFFLDDCARNTYDAFSSRFVETCTIGLGLMYRIVDVAGFFRALDECCFHTSDIVIRFTITDDFLPENSGSTVVRFEGGRASVVNEAPSGVVHEEGIDLEITTDIASFSSLWMGAIDFQSLLRMGLATVSDEAATPDLQRLFQTTNKPMCWQHF